jgi:hypothetical protein
MWATITTGIAGGVIIIVIAATGSFQGERKELTQREGLGLGQSFSIRKSGSTVLL